MVVKRHSQQSSSKKQHQVSAGDSQRPSSQETGYNMNSPWAPTPGLAFKLLMSARLCSALWSVISDCDETFNYWEPAHYLQYGKGFQTWEYSPVYAIRSYAYILLHVLPMKFCAALLGGEKILVFYLTRCVLGISCAASEMVFYRGVLHMFGPNVARLTLVLQLFATGMFISASAFLPSSFSMYLTMLAYGTWMLGKHNLAILSIAGSAILGWPFAAALGVPIAFDIFVLKRKSFFFIYWCMVSLAVFLLPTILVDWYYYGKLVIAPLNIVLYNVFSGHGPELYGIEPLSYYLFNGFLNYNFAFVLALGSLPFLLLISFFLGQTPKKRLDLLLSIAPMYIWILIFFTRPHKEERFLFPIYPFFAFSASLVLDGSQRVLQLLLSGSSSKVHYTHNTNWLSALFSVAFVALAFSRSIALYQGYHASTSIYVELNHYINDPEQYSPPPNKPVNLCVGKEWYRFPSSFFLPKDWELQFLQSEFKGLLPKQYSEGPIGTRVIPTHMNDMNQEEPTRYVTESSCQFLIDKDTQDWTASEPRYSDSPRWTVVKQIPFLDTARSHKVFRAFYIPYFSETRCTYTMYNLLRSKGVQKKQSSRSKKTS